MNRTALALSLLLALSASAQSPTTLRNDDSCDIGVAPAATLLLPYFEVDIDDMLGENTLFTVTNTEERAQVARVTLWTDYAYPVLTFDLYLTGYDVQGINLYDVISRGMIGGDRGTGVDVSPLGEHSKKNPLLDRSNCGQLPRQLDAAMVLQLKSALLEGIVPGCTNVGYPHEHAVGYATIDVAGNCTARGPTDPLYFSNDIRYDNVLIGDYVQLRAEQSFAQASPMVHIRALPGGGTPSTRIPGPLPRLERTFYGRFQDPADPHLDARQPLPSTFAARWINGGSGSFNTSLQIWRDGVTGPVTACADHDRNGTMTLLESVAFDEQENGLGISTADILIPEVIGLDLIVLPATSLVGSGDDDIFPQETFDENVGGWLYLNLDDGEDEDGRGAHQNWVTVRMESQGQYSVAFDAAWLGNGCSPALPVSLFSSEHSSSMPGPAEDVNP